MSYNQVSTTSKNDIYAQRYNSDNTKNGSVFKVNSYTVEEQGRPVVYNLNNGGYIITWTSIGQDGDNNGVYAQCYNSNNSKNGGEFLVNNRTSRSQDSPSIITLIEGGYVICYCSDDYDITKSRYNIYGHRYNSDNTAYSNEFKISSSTISTIWFSQPKATSFVDNGYLVTYVKSSNPSTSSQSIYARRYLYNHQLTSIEDVEFQVSEHSTFRQFNPKAAYLGGAGYIVVWDSNEGTVWNIRAQRFNINDVKIGSEFILSTSTSASNVDVVSRTDGLGYIVCWSSSHTGNSNIYCQSRNNDNSITP
jgi:hypothetical protein